MYLIIFRNYVELNIKFKYFFSVYDANPMKLFYRTVMNFL